MVCANADISCKQLMQTDAEAAVLCLINEQRAAAGVAPLTLNLKLVSAARQQAGQSVEPRRCSTTGRDPLSGIRRPVSRLTRSGSSSGNVGYPSSDRLGWGLTPPAGGPNARGR